MNIPNLRIGQAGSLYVAVVFSIVIGIGSSIITTRVLGPDDYGNLKFIQNFFQLLSTIATLGILPTGALLLARQKESQGGKHELIGAILIITVVLSLFFMLVSALFSFAENADRSGGRFFWVLVLPNKFVLNPFSLNSLSTKSK